MFKIVWITKMPVNSFKNYFLSWVPPVKELPRPCYLAIANLLEQDIRSGKLAPGTKLPPQRELADYLDINFTTVTRAYNLCRERQLIYGTAGRGTFVAPLPGRSEEDAPASGMIDLGVVNGFDRVNKQIIEATEAVLKKGYIGKLYNYTASLGHLHQRAAAVNWMKKFNVVSDENHTALFSGSQNAISAALLSLFKLGDTLAVDHFTYANLIGTARLAHIRLLPVAGDAGGMLPDALAEVCRRHPVAGIFLMPNCANPTGITLSLARKKQLAQVIRMNKLVLIEDDTATTVPVGDYMPMYALLPEQTLYICGTLRYLCGGLRVTAAAFPEAFRNDLLNGLFHLNIRTSALDAEIMTELLLSGRAESVLEEKHQLAVRANKIFDRVFPDAPECGNGSFFRILPLPESMSRAQDTESLFESYGIKVLHSSRFSVLSRPGRNFLRLSVSSAGSEKNLRTALAQVRFILGELPDK
ncbi:MAG: PLP-dependent aminotransferase family protein [Lentisphaerae bacterium]|nr:PLP-dependent aminotransferase family protein [Lentisphaerota bacterium]